MASSQWGTLSRRPASEYDVLTEPLYKTLIRSSEGTITYRDIRSSIIDVFYSDENIEQLLQHVMDRYNAWCKHRDSVERITELTPEDEHVMGLLMEFGHRFLHVPKSKTNLLSVNRSFSNELFKLLNHEHAVERKYDRLRNRKTLFVQRPRPTFERSAREEMEEWIAIPEGSGVNRLGSKLFPGGYTEEAYEAYKEALLEEIEDLRPPTAWEIITKTHPSMTRDELPTTPSYDPRFRAKPIVPKSHVPTRHARPAGRPTDTLTPSGPSIHEVAKTFRSKLTRLRKPS